MRRAVFLDRDGVLNHLIPRGGSSAAPRTLGEFALLPGVRGAIEKLRRAGLLVVVVTNQPDVARGTLATDELDRIHEHLRTVLPLDAIYTCAHDDQDGCECRKPKPGLIHRAGREWKIDLESSFSVGDSWKDIAAGKAAGCVTILVAAESPGASGGADYVACDLAAAGELILSQLELDREARAAARRPPSSRNGATPGRTS